MDNCFPLEKNSRFSHNVSYKTLQPHKITDNFIKYVFPDRKYYADSVYFVIKINNEIIDFNDFLSNGFDKISNFIDKISYKNTHLKTSKISSDKLTSHHDDNKFQKLVLENEQN